MQSPTEVPSEGATEAFEIWLAASREPDVKTACAMLSPQLKNRMVTQMQASLPDVTSCAQLMVATADLYRAFGTDSAHTVRVLHEDEASAELHVRYSGGDCGVVALRRVGSSWVITEQSEEQCD